MRISRYLILLFGFLANAGIGQVTFVLDSIPANTPSADKLFIAGTFNGWNAGDPNHMMSKNDEGLWETTLEGFAEGITIEFKFTRGDWSKVEKGPNGEEIDNRTYTFGNDSTVHTLVYNWADQGGGGGNSTAAENVKIVDESFYMPQLDRYRRIWIYLPPGYDETEKHYPVLYMHDGQNLFDQATSYIGEWEVDETLNNLAASGYNVPLVVGIDHGGIYRIDELTPWYNPQYGGGQGDDYLAFIVETLKPFIDQNYRTLTGRNNTGIMGSSLGGLISTYGALKYQEVFSKSGSFSPAYWINNDSIWQFVAKTGKKENSRFYQNMGEYEDDENIEDMFNMEDSLRSAGYTELKSKVIPGGSHDEQTWSMDFGEAYLWLFMEYATGIKEQNGYRPVLLFPNPVNDKVFLKNVEIEEGDVVRVSDSAGKLLIESNLMKGNAVDTDSLPPGLFVLKVIKKDSKVYVGKFVKR